ncbi:MAG: ATP-binding protein [Alphaproteobacteria bacterium]|nr:ATP-binding protein [Alphaproteobacteria bacterium]
MGTGTLLSWFLADRLLTREAEVMAEFIYGALNAEKVGRFFALKNKGAQRGDIAKSFRHVGKIPAVLRADVYGLDRSVLWSTEKQLIGKVFTLKDKLDRFLEEAFAGETKIYMGVVGNLEKEEHQFFTEIGQRFIKFYLPLWFEVGREDKVFAVVDLYRSPAPLFEAIEEGQRLMWLSAIAGGVFLFAVLFWVVRLADRIMRRQEAELVESERLEVAVEMASAVAHSLRNPLASIRSSAELALERDPAEDIREPLQDIIAGTDRLAHWVSQYLVDVSPETMAEGETDFARALGASMDYFRTQMERRNILPVLHVPADLPRIRTSELAMTQVLNSVISNAIEAMPDGGPLAIGVELGGVTKGGARLAVTVHNSGKPMTESDIEGAFRPFKTSKSGGLGLGLPLARRILNRVGGELTLFSDEGEGVTARISVPTVRSS